MDLEQILAQLREDSEAAGERMRAILSEAMERDDKNLTEDATREFDELVAAQETRQARIDQVEKQLARQREAKDTIERNGTGGATVTREESPYTPVSSMNGGPSFFRDVYRATRKGDRDAMDRLQRNNQMVGEAHQRAGISTVTGAGGELVPPLWLENELVPLARPGRVFADLCNKDRLPAGTDSISIPKVSTGTAVAAQGYPQGGQNVAIQETDLTTTSVSAGVYTVAGGQTVSMQLIEQSPLNVDKVVLSDLGKAYGIQVDQWSMTGSGTNQPTGVFNAAGINSIAVTGTAAPTIAQLYTALAQSLSNITKKRFMRPTHIVMHPMRWAWLLSQLDSSNRPLFIPQGGNFNPLGTTGSDAVNAEGPVGQTMGLPILLDPNVPTNLGTGTNQDAILMVKADDLWLWEGEVRAEAFEQTYANTLSLFIRLYNYMAFQPSRFPQSISAITGTAFASTYLAGF